MIVEVESGCDGTPDEFDVCRRGMPALEMADLIVRGGV